MWQSGIAALLLGLAGSVHCVGMCGPLVLSLPLGQLTPRWRASAMALYHGGRLGAYGGIGLVSGLAGRGFQLAGWQRGLSIGLGVLILVRLAGRGSKLLIRVPVFGRMQIWMARWWRSERKGKFLLLGFMNGLLPCGMVYLAMAGALTMSSVEEAMGFMFLFGAGTLPLLLGLQYTGHHLGVELRQWLRRALPYVSVFVAVLLILRGLNLGIPFLSPLLPGGGGGAIECH